MAGPGPEEWGEALRALHEPVSHLRSEALDALSSLLGRRRWSLPPDEAVELVGALRERLLDSNWSVCQRALGLVGELAANADAHLDDLMSAELVPPLIEKVSNAKVAVRKAASQALSSHISSTRHLPGLLDQLLRLGVRSPDWRHRQAALLFLSLPNATLAAAAADAELRPPLREVVAAAVGALSEPNTAVSSSAAQCLGRLRVGAGWGLLVDELPPLLRAAYAAWESPADTVGGDDDSDSDTEGGGGVPGAGLSFGFVPAPLLAELQQAGNWQARASAVGQLQALIQASDGAAWHARTAPHLPDLMRLLLSMLDEQNFRVLLTTLQILTSLVERFGEALGRWDDAPAVLLPPLMDKFADNRIVIRQANLTAVRALIHTLSPRRALRPMLTYISNPNSHIREQAITVLAQTMQASPTQPLELHRAALGALSLALEDVKPRVARAALDAMPVLAEAAGAPVFEWLMRELSMPESSEARVWERLKHGAAPPIAEALVEFTSQSSLSLPAVSDAPVRQGSASRRMADAPPTDDFSDLMENTAGGRPIATCGRGRLPWTRGGARGLGGMGALSEGNDPDEPAAGGDSYGWEGGARTDSVLGRRASASDIGGGAPPRAFRGRSEMSIVLPGEAALAPGPKSAPPMGAPAAPAPVMSGTPRSPRLRSALSSGGPSDRVTPASDSPPSPRSPTDWTDGAVSSSLPSPPRAGGMPSGSESTSPMGGRDSPAASFASPLLASFASFSSPVFGGSPASFASAASLGASSPHRSRDKILMWLPEAGAAADDAEPLLAPTARRPADGDESAGAGAHADPLKLLKQRRATPSAEELARASTATGGLRASPQVRLPFEERQRSQSAPQKRTAVASDEKVDSVDDGLSGAVAGTPEGRRAGLHIEPPPSVRADRTGRPVGMRPWRSSRLAGGDGGGVTGGGIDDGRRGAMGSGISLDVVGRSASAGGTGGAHDEQADAKGARGRGGGGWGSAEKGGATGGITELRTEDLSSYPPPGATETTVARAMAALRGGDRDGDWAAQFEAINTLRRLFASQPVGAPDAAILAQLHALNLLLLQFSDSLRSALAKNASMAFREMFCSMGKHMEADLDLITPVLIKKCAESNGFIAEEANRALAAMAVSVSEGRAIGALAGCASHRNPQARAKAALHLSRALEGMGWSRVLGMRELDKVVQVFGALNSEGLSETRIATKHGLVSLIREARRQGGDAQDRLERLLARCLPEPDQRKLLDAASASLTGTFPAPLEDMPEVSGRGAKGSRGSRHGTPGAVRPPPPEPLAGGGAVDEQLGSILGSLSSSDWISRRDGATQLLALVRAQPQAVPRSARLLSVLDALAPQLSYANPKVNLAALAALEGVAPMLKDALAPVAPGLVQALASCLASSNTQVRSAAPSCLDAVLAAVDPSTLLHPVANCALYSSHSKARGAMLERLGAISVTVYPTKPALVSKHSLGAAFHLLDENKPELKAATAALLRTLHALLGIGLFEMANKQSSALQQRLQEAVQQH